MYQKVTDVIQLLIKKFIPNFIKKISNPNGRPISHENGKSRDFKNQYVGSI